MTASLELQPKLLHQKNVRPRPRSRVVVPLLFVAFMVFCAVASRGFIEADEITHFLYARSVWMDWTMLVSIWGRLGCTGLYMWVAPLGVTAGRLLAAGITTLVGLGTGLLLKQLVPGIGRDRTWIGRHGVAIVWLLLFAQPCFAMDSVAVMTEMLLGCAWVWAAVVLMRCRGWRDGGVLLAGLLVGLGGLMRPEGWIAIACWPVFVSCWLQSGIVAGTPSRAARLRWVILSTLIAGMPVLLWYFVGVAAKEDWLWFLHQWPWSPHSVYGRTALQFLGGALISMAAWMWWPIAKAVRLTCRRGRWSRRRRAAMYLLVVPLVGLYALHGFLGSFGLFGSMSLPRYFISVAPMAAILALIGLIAVEKRLSARRARLFLRAAVIGLPLLLSVVPLVMVGITPTRPGKVIRELDVIAQVIESRIPPKDYEQRLILGHPYIILRLGLPIGLTADRRVYEAGMLANCAVGTMLVTEPQLWNNEGRPSADQLHQWGWREDEEATAKVGEIPPAWDVLSLTDDAKGHSTLWIKH